MRMIRNLSFLGVFFAASVAMASADTLVVKEADGHFGPGAAASWKGSGDAVVFVLAPGADGTAIAQTLNDRLTGATAQFANGTLTVTGIPQDALIEQLSALSLSGAADPLAELAGLGGGAIAMDTPEGGGSIRASKPTPMAMGGGLPADVDAGSLFEAEVVAVQRGDFPTVTLKLKMRKSARSSALRQQLHWGKVIEARVLFNQGTGGVSVADAANRRNIAAWYLKRKDRVKVHFVESHADGFQIDWISR